MASGRKSRAARRVPPPPTPSRRSLSRAVLLAGAVALALVVVGAAVAAMALLGKGTSSPKTDAAGRLPQAAQVRALFAGIPQRGFTLGATSAPVTIVEYFDLQCPYCRAYALDVEPTVIRSFVRSGRVRLELRPLAFIGADSVRGRDGLIAAARQNRAFDFAELLFENQGAENTWLSDSVVHAAAASIRGVDVPQFVADSGRAGKAAAGFDAQAVASGVHQVPALFVKRAGEAGLGRALAAPSEQQLLDALKAAGA